MSGVDDTTDCPRCGSEGTFEWSEDWKPVGTVRGECSACGFSVYTVFTVMSEEKRKEFCEDMELPFNEKRIENEKTKQFDETWGVE